MKIKEELYNKLLNEKYVVATRTQEEYDQFMQWLEDNTEIKWSDGDNICGFNGWKDNKEETCIAINYVMTSGLTYGNEINNKKNGYQIIEFKDLFTQDLRELLKVGYKVKVSGTALGYINLHISEHQLEVLTKDYNDELKCIGYESMLVKSIHRPKYNGIKSIGKPEWELVWERKEELYTLSLPNNCFGRKYLGVDLEKPTKYGFYKLSSSSKQANSLTRQFTQKEIDNLPNQDFIKTLDKKLYEETK